MHSFYFKCLLVVVNLENGKQSNLSLSFCPSHIFLFSSIFFIFSETDAISSMWHILNIPNYFIFFPAVHYSQFHFHFIFLLFTMSAYICAHTHKVFKNSLYMECVQNIYKTASTIYFICLAVHCVLFAMYFAICLAFSRKYVNNSNVQLK